MSAEGYGPDLRIFIGWMFAILGAILSLHGALNPGAHAPRTDFNVNLYWGLLLLLFGVVMLAMGYRAHRRAGE